MRIGMMADVYKPHVSGVTHYVELNKRYLETAGHDVFVFTFGDQERTDEVERVVHSPGLPLVDTGYYLSFSYSPSAKKLLQTMDIVHVQHPFLSGRLALRYCQPLRIPTVFTNHTRYDLYAQAYLPILPVEISDSLLRAYMPPFCQAMDLVISPSAGMAEVLRGMGVTSPIEIIPNGVELQRFYKAEPLSRADFGYGPQDVLLVYVGRIAAEKNLQFLLQAFAGAARALDHVHLLLIGGGPTETEIESLAGELGIGQRVRLLGMAPYEQVPSYLKMCDAFATTSISETFGLSVVEAMAAGLPIIGVRSPGVGDIVEDGETGLLAAPDLAGFTAKLMRVLIESDVRKRMGEAAQQASTLYAIERTTRQLLKHYERLVYASRPRRDSWSARLRGFLENHRQ